MAGLKQSEIIEIITERLRQTNKKGQAKANAIDNAKTAIEKYGQMFVHRNPHLRGRFTTKSARAFSREAVKNGRCELEWIESTIVASIKDTLGNIRVKYGQRPGKDSFEFLMRKCHKVNDVRNFLGIQVQSKKLSAAQIRRIQHALDIVDCYKSAQLDHSLLTDNKTVDVNEFFQHKRRGSDASLRTLLQAQGKKTWGEYKKLYQELHDEPQVNSPRRPGQR